MRLSGDLTRVALQGATGAVEALIVAKAGLEFTDKKKKNTPLHIACEKGFEEIIKVRAISLSSTLLRWLAAGVPCRAHAPW